MIQSFIHLAQILLIWIMDQQLSTQRLQNYMQFWSLAHDYILRIFYLLNIVWNDKVYKKSKPK